AVCSLHLPPRRGLGSAFARSHAAFRAFAEFDGLHLADFSARAQSLQVPRVYQLRHPGSAAMLRDLVRLLRPLYVGVKAWQFGQSSRRFPSTLLRRSPSRWSSSSGIGPPRHSLNRHSEHLFSKTPSAMSLSRSKDDLKYDSRTRICANGRAGTTGTQEPLRWRSPVQGEVSRASSAVVLRRVR